MKLKNARKNVKKKYTSNCILWTSSHIEGIKQLFSIDRVQYQKDKLRSKFVLTLLLVLKEEFGPKNHRISLWGKIQHGGIDVNEL